MTRSTPRGVTFQHLIEWTSSGIIRWLRCALSSETGIRAQFPQPENVLWPRFRSLKLSRCGRQCIPASATVPIVSVRVYSSRRRSQLSSNVGYGPLRDSQPNSLAPLGERLRHATTCVRPARIRSRASVPGSRSRASFTGEPSGSSRPSLWSCRVPLVRACWEQISRTSSSELLRRSALVTGPDSTVQERQERVDRNRLQEPARQVRPRVARQARVP